MNERALPKEFFTTAEPSSWKPWLVASLAAVAILGTGIGLMYAAGLFDIPKDDTGAKTLAAALALVGAVLSAAITLVGAVVKYSIDEKGDTPRGRGTQVPYTMQLGSGTWDLDAGVAYAGTTGRWHWGHSEMVRAQPRASSSSCPESGSQWKGRPQGQR